MGQERELSDFNPRSRVGSDSDLYNIPITAAYFNPRSRVGSDFELDEKAQKLYNFNPRSRVGSDDIKQGR